MASMSKIIIIGNVGRDPELRMTPNGRPVCDFSVAVNSKFTEAGEKKEKTDWYRVSCWGRQAEIAQQYIQKGQQVYVEGRFNARQYTTKDGQPGLSLDISCNDFQMLSGRRDRDGGMGGGEVRGENDTKAPDSFDPDEIPF